MCGNDRASYDLARSLREVIADRCGYYPEILCENTEIGRREISLTVDMGVSSLAKIEHDGEDVRIISDGIYGLSVASEKLYGMLFEGTTNGKAKLDISYSMSYTYASPSIEILNVVCDFPLDGNGMFMVQELAKLISESDGDVITFGASFSSDLLHPLKNNLDDRYYFIENVLSDGSVVPLLVDTSKISVVKETLSQANGLVRCELSLVQKYSGQSFAFVDLFAEEGATDCAGTVKRAFENTDDARVVIFASSDMHDAFDVLENGISVEYNSLINVGDMRSRCGVFGSTDLLKCSEVNMNTDLLEDTCFVNISMEKRYCDAFLKLIGSKDINN